MQDATALEAIPLSPAGVANLDLETRALIGFLARYRGKTRQNYELDLRQWWTWTHQHDLTMLNVERFHLELYIQQMQNRGLAESTVARRYGTVKGYLHYAYVDELIPRDPTVHVQRPKVDHKKQYRTYFTTLDFAAVLKEAMKDPRDHAVISLMGFVGLRVDELCRLDVVNLHRQIGLVEVHFIGKGGGYYKIGLPLAVVQAIDRYLDGRTEGALFINRHGNRIARRNVAAIIDRCAKNAGVTYHVTPHGLRRTLARTLQERGVELGAIQQVLRHVDPRVTSTCYIGDGGGVADVARTMATQIYTSMVA